MAKGKEADSDKNGRETVEKKAFANLKKGNKETSFTTENQPTPEAKSAGHQKKRMLRELAGMVITGAALENAKKTAQLVGLFFEDEDITLEILMTLRQIEKSLSLGDTQAYNAAMDRMRGKAQQSIDVTTGGEQLGSLKGKTEEELDEFIKTKLRG